MTSDEVIALALGILYLALAAMDILIARRLVRAERIKPQIEALTAMALIVVAVACGAAIGALLGFNGISRYLDGVVIIPSPLSLVLLAIALGLPSLACVYLFRLVRRWEREAKELHIHSRDGELPHPHRRKDDPPL